ncbi:hypothetical protein GGX14DRAFT_596689 [Mycena pura]|uniref:Uncharacterized protein n=1 Tax=Mycena pura TaxID=153505 RepID=A0AAD6Y2Z8_9AGAR|nr:hypothetical protein GGX14DRAFT_596689 [Mycena pura]
MSEWRWDVLPGLLLPPAPPLLAGASVLSHLEKRLKRRSACGDDEKENGGFGAGGVTMSRSSPSAKSFTLAESYPQPFPHTYLFLERHAFLSCTILHNTIVSSPTRLVSVIAKGRNVTCFHLLRFNVMTHVEILGSAFGGNGAVPTDGTC